MIPSDKVFTGNYEGQTAIICGSAPCLLEDFEEIKKHIGENYVLIGINEAIWALYCDKLITAHVDQMELFKRRSMNVNIETHTSKNYHPDWKDQSDYFWGDVKKGATSTVDAIQIAKRMGFDNIILAGCPMTGEDGYYYGKKGRENVAGCPRFGNPENLDLVHNYQKKLVDMLQKVDFSNVRSMSGFTANVFGKPKFEVSVNG